MHSHPTKALKPDAQAFDKVVITTVPRWKASGLSGDEWRISGHIQFWRKGELVHEEAVRDVRHACLYAGWIYDRAVDNGKGHFAGEPNICDQEGCCKPATVTYQLKQRFSREGNAFPTVGVEYRQFCEEHKHRGDCGLEDADRNYVEIANGTFLDPEAMGKTASG